MAWTGAENKRLRDMTRSGIPLTELVHMFPGKTPATVYKAVQRRHLPAVRAVCSRGTARGILEWIVQAQTEVFLTRRAALIAAHEAGKPPVG